MRIAQVAYIWLSVPPKAYGGAERIISLITDGLVERGHDVTLFASADSKTKAKLVSVIDKAPGINTNAPKAPYNMKNVFNFFNVLERKRDFDIIHWHVSVDVVPIMFASLIKKRSLITLHNHFRSKDIIDILQYYKKSKYFVSISDSHRKNFPFRFIGTVYNAIDLHEFEFNDKPKDYLVWIGRFSREKGVDRAIKIALDLRMPLKIAAPRIDNDYFKRTVKPYLGKKGIEYLGEVNKKEKTELLKNARVFLNPIQWEEPFGLVVPEANACGTPVVAFRRGSMPEVIKNNVNGFIVKPNKTETFVRGVKRILKMPQEEYKQLRYSSRKFVEDNFTIPKMIDGYEEIYKRIVYGRKKEK